VRSSTSELGIGGRGDRLVLRLATRGSPLALAQTGIVTALLASLEPPVRAEVLVVQTTGDRRQDLPISSLGGRGVFVGEVREAVLTGRADAAVHSAKDLPSDAALLGPDLVIAAVTRRADGRDALVGRTLAELGAGAVVATGAVRRRAQLAWLRPDLRFRELRGNVGTRLGRVPAGGAVVVAMAALERTGRTDVVAEVLDTSVMLPQAGQGAIAVECRVDDTATREMLTLVDDAGSRRTLDAERSFLGELGGGCDLPAGAHAAGLGADAGAIGLEAMVASADGHVLVRGRLEGTEPAALGRRLARHLLDERGGRALLDAVT
jgi:hydroxymethylbilane synthase